MNRRKFLKLSLLTPLVVDFSKPLLQAISEESLNKPLMTSSVMTQSEGQGSICITLLDRNGARVGSHMIPRNEMRMTTINNGRGRAVHYDRDVTWYFRGEQKITKIVAGMDIFGDGHWHEAVMAEGDWQVWNGDFTVQFAPDGIFKLRS